MADRLTRKTAVWTALIADDGERRSPGIGHHQATDAPRSSRAIPLAQASISGQSRKSPSGMAFLVRRHDGHESLGEPDRLAIATVGAEEDVMVARPDGIAQAGDLPRHRRDLLIPALRVDGIRTDRAAAEQPDGLAGEQRPIGARSEIDASFIQWNMYAALPITTASYSATLLIEAAGWASASRPATSNVSAIRSAISRVAPCRLA